MSRSGYYAYLKRKGRGNGVTPKPNNKFVKNYKRYEGKYGHR
ncbi:MULTISPECIES: hypothetical protein [unclassified Paenibacillus]|nr:MULTISPECIES: hypothetical protein [unclassified Paenibacillus]MDF9839549.1 hypothetical protein [Paenibacillus sp. PastF-2]MDF9846130.1 hypothetical protein [Paenibacillus sp. PastM-2]MDF9852702.1 hypothetical protein [Paenibacillus sp. PastF-1]